VTKESVLANSRLGTFCSSNIPIALSKSKSMLLFFLDGATTIVISPLMFSEILFFRLSAVPL
jgi:hypothetical protein